MKISHVLGIIAVILAGLWLIKHRKTVKKNSKKAYKSVSKTGKKAVKKTKNIANKVHKYFKKAI